MNPTNHTLPSFTVNKLKERKFRTAFLSVYLAFNLFSVVYFLTQGMIRNAILPVLYTALFFTVLVLIEYYFSIDCPDPFLVIIFSVPIGGILGTCYDLYTAVPFFDTLLQPVSGFIFASLGYVIMERILMSRSIRSRVAAVVFAFAFSLAIAVLWEMFEWLLTVTMNGDMQEDSIITTIRSYLLSGTHDAPLSIPNIEQTVIIFDGGKSYVIEGGYLDTGLTDTLLDMLVCLAGAVIFFVLGMVDALTPHRTLCGLVPHCEQLSERPFAPYRE